MEGGTRELFWVVGMFCILIGVLITEEYTFVKILQTLLLRSMHFTECKFYLKVSVGVAPLGSTEEIGLRGSG